MLEEIVCVFCVSPVGGSTVPLEYQTGCVCETKTEKTGEDANKSFLLHFCFSV